MKENHVLIEEDNPPEKIVIVEELLDGIDTDDSGKLEDLLKIVPVNKECGNPKVFDGGELTKSIIKKKKQDVLQACRCLHSVTNAKDESISSISIWNIVNQLGKYNFCCGLVVNNVKQRQYFSDQINRNRFDLVFAKC